MKSHTTVKRLDKFLSHLGLASRRDIKELLKTNEVRVNGKRVTSSGIRVDPAKDTITLNGKKLQQREFVYYLFNKPIGVISSARDYLDRPTVVDYIETSEKIYPIGRLDKDTHGLILLTNNGELTHKLIHPKYHVAKTYQLTVSNTPTEQQIHALRTGVLLSDGITLPAQVQAISSTDQTTVLEMVIHEGRNRQIRRMCAAVGIELTDLKRTAFGPLSLSDLKEGEYRELTEKEIQLLHAAVTK